MAEDIDRLLDKLTLGLEALTEMVEQQEERRLVQERRIVTLCAEFQRLKFAQEKTGSLLLEVVKEIDAWRGKQRARR